ncbi:ABC transporter permease [Arcanobacterium sp. S3PF19]|uniref:ABC transporter permease n=1 Tax=Arcanobacterium sp. S3PF19 TaxID=1219585 RepID=UPI00068EC2EE|nr:ABC transporter permease [Arcanobacterium sp. S3PF19]
MNGISSAKLAWYATIRRPVKSSILLAIMAIITTALVSQAGIRTAMSQLRGAIDANVGAGFTAAAKDGPLAPADAERLARLPGIRQHAYEAETLASLRGAKPVKTSGAVQTDGEFAGSVTAAGTTDSALDPSFLGRLYRLEEGKHLRGKVRGALVHRKFADLNGLKPGSTLTVEYEGRSVNVAIKGIFGGTAENPSGLPAGASENRIFMNLSAHRELTGKKDLSAARYFTESGSRLAETINRARAAAPNLELADNSAQFSGVMNAISGVEKMLSVLIVGFCAISVGVLGLVFVFWARGRIHEIGILLSLGKSKTDILLQLALETVFLGVAAGAVGLVCGTFLSGFLAEALTAGSADPVLRALHIPAGGICDTAAALCGSFLLIFGALACALMPILRKPPKAILSSLT